MDDRLKRLARLVGKILAERWHRECRDKRIGTEITPKTLRHKPDDGNIKSGSRVES